MCVCVIELFLFSGERCDSKKKERKGDVYSRMRF